MANRKTNAFNKSDLEACERVFLSALVALQKRVVSDSGNAIVNIQSFYKKKPNISADTYECHAGTFVSGVALKGDIIRSQ